MDHRPGAELPERYYYISDKFSEYGLELTEDNQTQIDNTTTNFWRYYQSTFEDDLGIARDSFSKAYSEYTVKFQKVMEAMYGEGGRAGPGRRGAGGLLH